MKIIVDKTPFGKGNAYHKIYVSITKDSNLSNSAFRLFVLISNWSRTHNNSSVNGLAKLIGLSPKEMENAITNLKTYGYLESTNSNSNTIWTVHPLPSKNPNYLPKRTAQNRLKILEETLERIKIPN